MVGSVEEMVEMGRYLWIQFSTICMLNFMVSPPVLAVETKKDLAEQFLFVRVRYIQIFRLFLTITIM